MQRTLRSRGPRLHSGEVGSVSIARKYLTRQEKADAKTLDALAFPERPAVRGDCERGPRPCPWVGCSKHLYLSVSETGAIKFAFPHLQPGELEQTCSLDVADDGPQTLGRVGELTNVTRERTRQIEVRALLRARDSGNIDPGDVNDQ